MKLFLVTWYIYAFFIHASYDCNLRAYLMQVDKEKPINTAKDIVEQDRKEYFFEGFNEREIHEGLPEETFKYEKQYAKRSYENGYTFINRGYEPPHIHRLMLDEGIVTFAVGSHILGLNSNKDKQIFGYLPFRLSKYPTRVSLTHAGLIIPKDSALRPIFYPIIMRLIEADIVEHYARSSYYIWGAEKKELPEKPLNLQHMLIGFSIFFMGIFLSVLSLSVSRCTRVPSTSTSVELFNGGKMSKAI